MFYHFDRISKISKITKTEILLVSRIKYHKNQKKVINFGIISNKNCNKYQKSLR